MQEVIMRNAELGIQMTRIQWQGVDVVYAEDMRKALRWDRVIHMIRGLKPGKEYIKVSVSDLESEGLELGPNLGATSSKGGHPFQYAVFITRQGVSRLIATRRPHDIKDDPELAVWLDRLQDWVYGEVLPEVFATGSYTGGHIVAGQHAVNGLIPASYGDALRALADEHEAHDLTIQALEQAQLDRCKIGSKKVATAMAHAKNWKYKYKSANEKYINIYNVLVEISKVLQKQRIRKDKNDDGGLTEPLF